MTPPHAKTWSPRGRTSVVRVRGRSRRRISIAALTCYKPGHRSRLIYRPRRAQKLLLARLPGPAGRRPPTTRPPDRPRLGQPQCPQSRRSAGIRRIPGLADHPLPAALRTRPQPRRRHLVPPAARLALQRRFLHTRAPHPHSAERPTAHPVPQQPHRRLPHRDRPDHPTRLTSSTTSRVQPQ